MIYVVPLIPQTTRMSCWAAGIAMILAWRHQASFSDQLIAQNPGGLNYMTSYNQGLDPNDKYILAANGFAIETPMCYAPEAISALLQRHGPLWVATWAPLPHIRVVTGMIGNIVYVNDPQPVNVGSQYTRTFAQFFGSMENLGRRELREPSPVYVAYLRS